MFFTGCALTPERAALMTPHELCQEYAAPRLIQRLSGVQRVAYAELQKRGIECDVQAYVAAENERRRRLFEMGTQMIEQAQPPQPAPSQSYRETCRQVGYFTRCRRTPLP